MVTKRRYLIWMVITLSAFWFEKAQASTITWVGGAPCSLQCNSWTDPNNWDAGQVPTSTDTANFDGSVSNTNAALYSDPPAVGGITIQSNYIGNIRFGSSIGGGVTVTVMGNYNQQGGNMSLQASNLHIFGDWNFSGGTLNVGTSTVFFHGTGTGTNNALGNCAPARS